MAIYLTRRLRRDTLKEIGAQFGVYNDNTVSSVMERTKKKLAGDRKFSLRLDKIADSITKTKSVLDPLMGTLLQNFSNHLNLLAWSDPGPPGPVGIWHGRELARA